MKNYFVGKNGYPSHLSIGALVIKNGKIFCHHFKKYIGYKINYKDFYLLMRETTNPNETIEQALKRGLKEEFNISAKIVDYLGSIKSHFYQDRKIEKTTLYFLCKFEKNLPGKRDLKDPESSSEVLLMDASELIKKMRVQFKKYKRTDMDESEIIGRYLKNSN